MAYSGDLFGGFPFLSILNGTGWNINYNSTTPGQNGSGGGGLKFITATAMLAVPEMGSMTLIGLTGLCTVLVNAKRRRRRNA
jgi:hypothetical protein